jgi:hypothetical protein
MYRAAIVSALLTALVAAGQSADKSRVRDWTEWRGPYRDAVCSETGLLK